MKTIFVFAYYSYRDPVFSSAVLPYLKLVKNDNIRFVLLTWEQNQFKLTEKQVKEIGRELRNQNIIWHKTVWHSGRFKIIKKAYDFIKGLLISIYLIYKYKVSKIYSEGFPGAILGYYLSRITSKKHVIHTFEAHADCMVEAQVWSKKSWEYKLVKSLEIPIAKHAQFVVTATNAYKEVLLKRGAQDNIKVIPSCIDYERLKFMPDERLIIRNQLGIMDDVIVIVYMGKLGGMYMEDELYDFLQYCHTLDLRRFYFFIFTNESIEQVENELNHRQISSESILIKYLSKDQVPKYLSAADIGFCGVRPIPSQRYSSPIKNGEYWASGLPIIIPKGVSDDHILVEKLNVGICYSSKEQIGLDDLKLLTQLDRAEIIKNTVTIRGIDQYKEAFNNLFLE